MKTKNLFKNFAINVFAVMGLTVGLFAPALGADDNEVLLDQQGDNLTLTILQAGSGNKISGDASDSADLVITGANLIIDELIESNLKHFEVFQYFQQIMIMISSDLSV